LLTLRNATTDASLRLFNEYSTIFVFEVF